MMAGSFDQSKSHLKNRKIIQKYPVISNPSELFWSSHFNSTGLLQPPPLPYLSQSYPPYTLRQPPLLPLPAAAPRRNAALTRRLSCPPINQKISNPNKTSVTPKKSESPKKVDKNSPKKSTTEITEGDRRNFKKDTSVVGGDEAGIFSGVFTISPPPSSLPLPTFSLRRCKVEAVGGVDAGATDDLRRLLRLR